MNLLNVSPIQDSLRYSIYVLYFIDYVFIIICIILRNRFSLIKIKKFKKKKKTL